MKISGIPVARQDVGAYCQKLELLSQTEDEAKLLSMILVCFIEGGKIEVLNKNGTVKWEK